MPGRCCYTVSAADFENWFMVALPGKFKMTYSRHDIFLPLPVLLGCLLISGILGMALIPVTARADDPERLVQSIQARYQSIAGFAGRFHQISQRAGSELPPREASGTVSFLRPGKMRWNYESPEEQLLVTDGITLWLYDPLLENVTIQELAKITEGTALSFLLGFGDLQTDFKYRPQTRKHLQDVSGLLVEMEPRHPVANLAYIQLEVDPETYDLLRILLADNQNNHRIITFQSMRYNVPLDAEQFQFEVTPGMEVIEAE